MAAIGTLMSDQNSGKCRARSDCTNVQADLALHFPNKKKKKKSIVNRTKDTGKKNLLPLASRQKKGVLRYI